MPNNTVRIDDITPTNLTFPRDQPFIVQVTLQIQAPQSAAHIVHGGAGTSGSATTRSSHLSKVNSRQFGAIRIWRGFDIHGAFDATNVVVTRRV